MTSPSPLAQSDMRAIVWERTHCPLCRADREKVLLETPGPAGEPAFRLVRCAQCGMGYLNPRPDADSIGRFYPPDYEDHHRSTGLPRRASRWQQYVKRLVMADRYGTPRSARNWVERALARVAGPWFDPGPDSLLALPYRGEGRLLDYGCGSGWLCRRLQECGWSVVGMDVSAVAAEQARRAFGLSVLVGKLPHPEVKPGSFDVITMGQVLEHVHRPHEVIDAAVKALRPNGCLVVGVPNLESWGFHQFREHWHGLQLPIHLLHFTAATLRALLEFHGLKVQSERMLVRPSCMHKSLAKASAAGWHMPWWMRLGSHTRLLAKALARGSVAAGRGDLLQVVACRTEASSDRQAA